MMYGFALHCLLFIITIVCIERISCQEVVNESCHCSRGSHNINGTCYSINDRSTYADATKYCQLLDGHLVKLEPSNNIKRYLESVSSEFSDVWIGLDDKEEEGSFRWIADRNELNWNISNFRSGNDEDLDCIGMDSSGDFQFLNCITNHAAICDLKVCQVGSCLCYSAFTDIPIDLYDGDRCIISLPERMDSFIEQEETCQKIGSFVNNETGSLAIIQPWYDVKNIIMEQIQSFPRGMYFWIGLTDIEVEGQVKFRNSDVNILNVTDIDFNADNSDAMDCVSINTKSGQWNYALCSKMLPFICQTEPNCEAARDGTPTPPYTELVSLQTKDFPQSHVVMVSMVAGVIGSSLAILAVIVVICVVSKYFKASLQRFGRYKMSTVHDTPYTEVEHGQNIEPSDSFLNRPTWNRPLPLAESYSVTTNGDAHFYEDSESNDETKQRITSELLPIYNGGDSITYEDVDSPTERTEEIVDNSFRERALRASSRTDVNTSIKEKPFESRTSRIILLNDGEHLEDSDAAEGVPNLNNCYHEIGGNIYQDVDEMKMADGSYDDVSIEGKEAVTPDMTYNEFYDGSGVPVNVTLDMVYNDSYDHGHFEGNTSADYDEI